MLIRSWAISLQAKNNELKLASGMALASVIIILFIVFWSVFISDKNTADTPNFKQNNTVQTIDPPSLKEQQTQPSNKNITKKKIPSKNAAKSTPATTQNRIVLGQGNYYLQVGAFKQAKLARLMLEKMKKKYQYAKIKQKTDKHAVWVGPVVTKDDALKLQKYVQRKDNIKGFITAEK